MAISTLEAPAQRRSDARVIFAYGRAIRWPSSEKKRAPSCLQTSTEGAGGGRWRRRTRAGTDPDYPHDAWGLAERRLRSFAPTGGWKYTAMKVEDTEKGSRGLTAAIV